MSESTRIWLRQLQEAKSLVLKLVMGASLYRIVVVRWVRLRKRLTLCIGILSM